MGLHIQNKDLNFKLEASSRHKNNSLMVGFPCTRKISQLRGSNSHFRGVDSTRKFMEGAQRCPALRSSRCMGKGWGDMDLHGHVSAVGPGATFWHLQDSVSIPTK